jgi:hypothetical protein
VRKKVTIEQGQQTVLGVDLRDLTNPFSYVNPFKVAQMGMTAMANGARAMMTGEVPIVNNINVRGASSQEVDEWMGTDPNGRGMSGTPLNYAPNFTSSTKPGGVQEGRQLHARGLLPKFVPDALRGAVGSEVRIHEKRARNGDLEAEFDLSGHVANGEFDFEIERRRGGGIPVDERGVVRPLPDVPAIFNPAKAVLGTVMGTIHLKSVEAANAIEHGARQAGYQVVRKR